MKFDLETAIEDVGNCHRQKCKCEECVIGLTVLKAKGKDRIEDLCNKDMVYYMAVTIKNYLVDQENPNG